MKNLILITSYSLLFFAFSTYIYGMDHDEIIYYKESGNLVIPTYDFLKERKARHSGLYFSSYLTPTTERITIAGDMKPQVSMCPPELYMDAISCILYDIEHYIELNKQGKGYSVDVSKSPIVKLPQVPVEPIEKVNRPIENQTSKINSQCCRIS